MPNEKMELTTKAEPILGKFKDLGGFCGQLILDVLGGCGAEHRGADFSTAILFQYLSSEYHYLLTKGRH